MKATQSLPENFTLSWSLDLRHDMRLNLILQFIGLGLMALAFWLFTICVKWLRPDMLNPFSLPEFGLAAESSANALIWLVILMALMIVVIALHELVHALFFWLFARQRPQLGLGPGYAYAAMPDWYFPRKEYLFIALSPVLVLTALGLGLSLFLPAAWLALPLAGMAINAGGAIGDIYICLRIARDSEQILIKDTGDGFQLYRPVA